MKVATFHSLCNDSTDAARQLADAIEARLECAPDCLLLYSSVSQDLDALRHVLRERFPKAAFAGGTSCLGVMTGEGFHARGARGVGVFAISDPGGFYGAASASLEVDGAGSIPDRAAEVLIAAMEQAGRIGEMPELLWLVPSPGHEEPILAGIASLTGPHVPVAGGSSADNSVEGKWQQFANDSIHSDGMAVSVWYPSTRLGMAFASGYVPTGACGVVDSVEGRVIHRIAGVPAAQWYNAHTDGLIAESLSGGVVLSNTTFRPLGRRIGTSGEIDLYALCHPERVTSDGSLTVFTDISPGESLIIMEGSVETLVSRAARVTEAAVNAVDGPVAGVLMTFCAGCMLAIKPHMQAVVDGVREQLGADVPFLGIFTFGEQGIMAGHHVHANLMISAVAVGRA